MKAIPAIAAYDSWKLTECMEDGEMVRCIIKAENRSDAVVGLRRVIAADSLRRMKMKALTIEGPAPVATVYMPHNDSSEMLLNIAVLRFPPVHLNVHAMML